MSYLKDEMCFSLSLYSLEMDKEDYRLSLVK